MNTGMPVDLADPDRVHARPDLAADRRLGRRRGTQAPRADRPPSRRHGCPSPGTTKTSAPSARTVRDRGPGRPRRSGRCRGCRPRGRPAARAGSCRPRSPKAASTAASDVVDLGRVEALPDERPARAAGSCGRRSSGSAAAGSAPGDRSGVVVLIRARRHRSDRHRAEAAVDAHDRARHEARRRAPRPARPRSRRARRARRAGRPACAPRSLAPGPRTAASGSARPGRSRARSR